MEARDRLTLRTDFVGDAWLHGGPFPSVSILVNDVPLIELVRAAELPFAEAEYDRRIAAGETEEDIGPRGSLAGQYDDMPGELTYLPSRNLLGEPFDPYAPRSVLLGCSCGVFECWMFLARIEVAGDRVRWSEFGQAYRPAWRYDVGPFEFDRPAYEAALRRPDGFWG